MKNKKFTYILGILVSIVWGVIIYRIFASVASNKDDTPVTKPRVNTQAYNDYTIPKDTSRLLLNYKDPFGLKKQKDTTSQVTTKPLVINTNKQLLKPVFNWNFIKYSGFIRNPGSKKLLAVVNINGKPITMAEGETAEQVKLIKNLQDSIKVSFNGKTAFIKM
jgi:hypothetical protein